MLTWLVVVVGVVLVFQGGRLELANGGIDSEVSCNGGVVDYSCGSDLFLLIYKTLYILIE